MTSLIDRTSDVLLGRILASVLAVFGAIAILLAALGVSEMTERRFLSACSV